MVEETSFWIMEGLEAKNKLQVYVPFFESQNSTNSDNGKLFRTHLAVKPDLNGCEMIYNCHLSLLCEYSYISPHK